MRWALEHAFQGGSFFGHSLAGFRVGELQGAHVFRDVSYVCDFTEPPTGTWYLCMMLREWNGVAYETRDFINFDVPYVVKDHSLQEPSNVIVVDFKEAATSHANVETNTDSAPVVTPPQRKKSINPNFPLALISNGSH